MARTYAQGKFRESKDKFVMLPHELLDSEAWKSLAPPARCVFVCLLRQYNGRNNGDLSFTKSTARAFGLPTSGTTLRRTLDALWERGFTVLTRPGCFGSTRTCNLWAVTIWPIDDCHAKDIKATSYASDHWKRWTKDQASPDYRQKFPSVEAKRRKQVPKKSQVVPQDLTGSVEAPKIDSTSATCGPVKTQEPHATGPDNELLSTSREGGGAIATPTDLHLFAAARRS